MNRLAPAALVATLALLGCPAVPGGTVSVTPASTASPTVVSTGAPNATPTTSVAITPTPTAAFTPIPLPAPRAMGVGPTGGSLADVKAAYTGTKPLTSQYRLTFQTTQGEFVMTLFPEVAPAACAKFKLMCEQGIYDRTSFHRVISGFVAQGGDPLSKDLPETDPRVGTGGYGDAVPDDFGNGLKHLPGAVAFAHSSAQNSSFAQFYICLQALQSLNGGYTVFGQVIEGFDTVQRLQLTEQNGAKTTAKRDRIISVKVTE